ncbi:hypothetical protein VTK26DRAFT_5679 [Humicola hyalothermophila]
MDDTVDDMAIRCEQCKLDMPDEAALVAHWKEQKEKGNGHYHCAACVAFFPTRWDESRHNQQFHPIKQNLSCPGCNAKFTTAGSLVGHIERNLCNKITNDDFAARREQKLAFARELQRRHGGEDPDLLNNLSASVANMNLSEGAAKGQHKGPDDFTKYISGDDKGTAGTQSLSALRPKAEGTVRPNPVTFATMKASEPPQQQQPTRGGRPTAAHQAAGQLGTQESRPWPQHDPRNPGWNAKDYYVTFIDKYKCPHECCA